MSFIEIKNLTKLYDDNVGIKELNLSIEKHSFVSIVGSFGSGKTTLLRVIAGLNDGYKGSVLIDGVSPAAARRSRRIGMSFQQPSLLPWRNVLGNVMLPFEIIGQHDDIRAKELISLAGLSGAQDKQVHQLSGGMRQLVAIIRSLALNPDILLLDEPFGSIDDLTKDEMNEKLRIIHRKEKKTTILVTHSLQEAVYLSDVVVIMSPSPGTVKRIIPITFDRFTITDKYSDEAMRYVALIRNELAV